MVLGSLYLLTILDHLSKLNCIPLCSNYDNLLSAKLIQPLYSSEVLLMCELLHSDPPQVRCL